MSYRCWSVNGDYWRAGINSFNKQGIVYKSACSLLFPEEDEMNDADTQEDRKEKVGES